MLNERKRKISDRVVQVSPKAKNASYAVTYGKASLAAMPLPANGPCRNFIC
jgi:hypothetical protein